MTQPLPFAAPFASTQPCRDPRCRRTGNAKVQTTPCPHPEVNR